MIVQAGPTIGADYPGMLLIVFAVLGLASVVYVALKFDRRAPAIALLLGLGMLFTLVGYQRSAKQSALIAEESAELAEREAEAEAMKLQQMYEELSRPRIKLDADDAEEPSGKKSQTNERTEDAANEDSTTEAKRPGWVDQPAQRVGNVFRKVVVSDPYDSIEACHRGLQDHQLRDAINERIDELAPNRYRPALEKLGLGPDFMWRDLCSVEWVETLDVSFGEMKRVYALLEFDAAVDRQIAKAYRDYERQFRINEVGGVAGIGLGSLALLFGLLKVDTWTKGYYTKRLFFGVPAVIIAVVALLIS